MTLSLSLTREPGYLTARVHGGPVTLQNLAVVLAQATAATAKDDGANLFVDLTEVEGTPSFTDQFLLGNLVARELRHLGRVAAVVRSGERTGITGKVASLHGFSVRTFECGVAARNWLLEDAPSMVRYPGAAEA